jgi:ABC-2 type transport system permease protein
VRASATIAQRELADLFAGRLGWAASSAVAAVCGFLFFPRLVAGRVATVAPLLEMLPLVLILVASGLGMWLVARDRASGALVFVRACPVSEAEIAIGKYAGGLAALAVILAGTTPIAIIVAALGDLDPGPVAAGYASALLLGAAYLGIALFAACVASEPLSALLLSLAACLLWSAPGLLFSPSTDAVLGRALELASPIAHHQRMVRGIVELRGVVYLVTVAAAGVAGAITVLELRRRR